MCFVNNYTDFMLSVIDMTFIRLHDVDLLDPSVLVLQDRLSRYRVGMYFINYQLLLPVVTCNLYIINYKFGFFVTCSFRKYSTLDSR